MTTPLRLSLLERWLRHHPCADATERAHRARMTALLASPGDPLARDHFVPGHFTASGFVLSPEGDALLLVHHRKLDRWLQPGGHVEPEDADLQAAAHREVVEETGLAALRPERDGVFDLDIHEIPALGDEPPHAHFDVRFLFRARERALRGSAEVKAARFVPLARLLAEARAPGSDPSVMRVVRKLSA